jgi:hypothetical protein
MRKCQIPRKNLRGRSAAALGPPRGFLRGDHAMGQSVAGVAGQSDCRPTNAPNCFPLSRGGRADRRTIADRSRQPLGSNAVRAPSARFCQHAQGSRGSSLEAAFFRAGSILESSQILPLFLMRQNTFLLRPVLFPKLLPPYDLGRRAKCAKTVAKAVRKKNS